MGRANGAEACVEPMRLSQVEPSRKDPSGVGGVGEIIFVKKEETNKKNDSSNLIGSQVERADPSWSK